MALGEGGQNGERIPVYAEVSQLADGEGCGCLNIDTEIMRFFFFYKYVFVP